MKPLTSIELHFHSVPLVILIDPHLSKTLPSVSGTDLTSKVFCLTWMKPLISIELHLHSIPLVILIDPHLSKTLPSVSGTDLSSEVFCLT